MDKRKVGVLISGGGSNLQALIDACDKADFPAEIAVVISSKADAYGLNRARNSGIPAHIIEPKDYPTRDAFDDAMQQMLERHLVEFVCLAGFMRLLTPRFVNRWEGKMLNIHPSLLPAFKGAHAHKDVLEAGVNVSGCTVHFVTPDMDSGPIVAQAEVPVLPDDTLESLAGRVLEQEHRIYPQALGWLVEGKLSVKGDKVTVTK